MVETSIVKTLKYWFRTLLTSEGQAYNVASWQVVAYLLAIEKRQKATR